MGRKRKSAVATGAATAELPRSAILSHPKVRSWMTGSAENKLGCRAFMGRNDCSIRVPLPFPIGDYGCAFARNQPCPVDMMELLRLFDTSRHQI